MLQRADSEWKYNAKHDTVIISTCHHNRHNQMSSTTWSSFGKYLVRLTRLFCKRPSVELPHTSSGSASLFSIEWQWLQQQSPAAAVTWMSIWPVPTLSMLGIYQQLISTTHTRPSRSFNVKLAIRSLRLLSSSSLLELSYHCCYCTLVSSMDIISFDVFWQGVHVLDLVADVLSVSMS